MTIQELEEYRKVYFTIQHTYKMHYWKNFDYDCLSKIMYHRKSGRGGNESYNDCIIMADTETSKTIAGSKNENNIVVAWTISIRAYGVNIATLWGHKPSSMMKCIKEMLSYLQGDETYIYFHNFSYDYIFLRKFIYREFGYPVKQLNTKSHYPIMLGFENGLIFKDSLILAQRSLERWANDLDVEHKKAVGKWDYDKLRTQHESYTADELEYIEHDTLAGVECIDKLRVQLNKKIYAMPYTATGIPREEARKIGKANKAKELFNRMHPTFEEQLMLERVYHGGYTHANRHLIDVLIDWSETKAFDFASSYPFSLCAKKYPCEAFTTIHDMTIQDVLSLQDDYAIMFKLILVNPIIKDDFIPMPVLQFSKCITSINAILDNGRVLKADYVEIEITEQDAAVIFEQYNWDKHICTNIHIARKDYLPRWFTDYVYKCFVDKTQLKGGDKVSYALAKAKLNSLYGMCVQKPIKETLIEEYETGAYIPLPSDSEELYNKYLENRNSILLYQTGVWCTAYAMRSLFKLGKCVDYEPDEKGVCGDWVYCDTDSIYATRWDYEKVNAYNESCKQELLANGYGAVLFNGREYWLGVAEHSPEDDTYTEFKVQGAKRYCGRNATDKELHITVAGVPKKTGVKCLNDDINNFTKGLIFAGSVTGKLTHTYIYVDEIFIDEKGNEVADSIDLSPCDYLLDSVYAVKWEELETQEVEIQVYEEELPRKI